MRYSENGPEERRNKQRFEIRREMRYTLREDGKVIGWGTGSTLDIGSKGAAFTTPEQLKPGTAIEISVSWPALLDGRCALRLVASGQVLRSAPGMAACSISTFEFRTQGQAAAIPRVAPLDRKLPRVLPVVA